MINQGKDLLVLIFILYFFCHQAQLIFGGRREEIEEGPGDRDVALDLTIAIV